MKSSRFQLAVGVLLLLVGALLLAGNFDLLQFDVASLFGNFWPLIPLLVGLYLVMSNKQWYSIIAVGSVLIAIWSVSYAPQIIRDYLSGNRHLATQQLDEPLGGSTQIAFDLERSSDRVLIHSSNQADTAYSANFTNAPAMAENLTRSGSQLGIRLERDTGGRFWHNNDTSGNLELGLPTTVPISLDIASGAHTEQLDLSELQLTTLELGGKDGSSDVIFGQKANATNATIELKRATLTLHIPKSSKLTITLDNDTSGLSQNFAEAGMEASGNTFSSTAGDGPSLTIHLSAENSTVTLVRT